MQAAAARGDGCSGSDDDGNNDDNGADRRKEKGRLCLLLSLLLLLLCCCSAAAAQPALLSLLLLLLLLLLRLTAPCCTSVHCQLTAATQLHRDHTHRTKNMCATASAARIHLHLSTSFLHPLPFLCKWWQRDDDAGFAQTTQFRT